MCRPGLRAILVIENAFGHDAETEAVGTHLDSPLAGIRPTVAHSPPPSPQAAGKRSSRIVGGRIPAADPAFPGPWRPPPGARAPRRPASHPKPDRTCRVGALACFHE
jgi:hypothetical protein